ncbi:MAG TPA: nucleoside monophosphate kinase [Candidatus Dormibacteraeota bacterium]|nr:nucleoside monophosphate kinase [Candidatus Dormibacteraeota bacterium]
MLVLLGPPGAGKGTQSRVLSGAFGIPHIATGDLFRAEARAGTALGVRARGYMERGELVPDAITIDLLLDRLARPDAADGAILDGFPRTALQAAALDVALALRGPGVDEALLIEVGPEELVRRLSSRWICSADGGHVYNVITLPPRVPGRCDIDAAPLVQRADDTPETVRARLAAQLGALADVVAHYAARGLLRVVDGELPVEDVSRALLAAVRPLMRGRA